MTALIFFSEKSNAIRFKTNLNRFGYDAKREGKSVEIQIDEDDLVVLNRDVNMIATKIGASPFSKNF